MDIKDCKVGMPVRRINIPHDVGRLQIGEIGIISGMSTKFVDSVNIEGESTRASHKVENLEPAYSLEVGCKVRVHREGEGVTLAYNGLEGIIEHIDEIFYNMKTLGSGLLFKFYESDLIVIEPAPKKEIIAHFCRTCNHGIDGNDHKYGMEEPCYRCKDNHGGFTKWQPIVPAIPSGTAYGGLCPHANVEYCGDICCDNCRSAGKHLYKGCDCQPKPTDDAVDAIQLLLPADLANNGVMFTREAIEKAYLGIGIDYAHDEIASHYTVSEEVEAGTPLYFDGHKIMHTVSGKRIGTIISTGGNKMSKEIVEAITGKKVTATDKIEDGTRYFVGKKAYLLHIKKVEVSLTKTELEAILLKKTGIVGKLDVDKVMDMQYAVLEDITEEKPVKEKKAEKPKK